MGLTTAIFPAARCRDGNSQRDQLPLVCSPTGLRRSHSVIPCLPALATLNGINCAAARLVFPLPPGGLPAFVPNENQKFFGLPNALPGGINSAVRRSADQMPFRQLVRANCGGKGIRTLDTLLRYTHFPGVLLRPLGHSSKIKNQCQKTKFGFGYQPVAPHSQLTGKRLANSQEPLLRVKVRINICCVQHPCEFRRFCNPFAHKDHSVISPRIGVCR